MPNPEGFNGWEGFKQPELPYGSQRELEALTSMEPLPGGPTPGANAPQRAQRQATRRAPAARTTARAAPISPSPAPSPLPVAPPSPESMAAVEWQRWASLPGASDLVKAYAAQAQQEAGAGV